jgi:chromosome segregation ATPase
LHNQLDEIESKFHEQNYHLAQTNQDLNDQKLTATQIRLLAEESERALDEQRRQISIKNDELHTLEQANYRLEQKLSIRNFIKIFIIYFNFYLLFS